MVDGEIERVPLGVEVAGPRVALALELGLEAAELRLEQLAEQAGVAERLAPVVERHEDVMDAAELGQGPARVARGEDGLADRCGQLVED